MTELLPEKFTMERMTSSRQGTIIREEAPTQGRDKKMEHFHARNFPLSLTTVTYNLPKVFFFQFKEKWHLKSVHYRYYLLGY